MYRQRRRERWRSSRKWWTIRRRCQATRDKNCASRSDILLNLDTRYARLSFGTPHLVSGINFLVLSTPSTSFQSLCLWLACSCSYHVYSLCQLTTLTIHNSLSLIPGSRPTFFTNRSHHRLPSSSWMTPRTLWLDHFFWASRFFAFSFFIFLFGSVRQIQLAVHHLLGVRKYNMYRIISLALAESTVMTVI